MVEITNRQAIGSRADRLSAAAKGTCSIPTRTDTVRSVAFDTSRSGLPSSATLDGGNPMVGTVTAETQLQYTLEPSTWLLVAGGLGLVATRLRRLR